MGDAVRFKQRGEREVRSEQRQTRHLLAEYGHPPALGELHALHAAVSGLLEARPSHGHARRGLVAAPARVEVHGRVEEVGPKYNFDINKGKVETKRNETKRNERNETK